MPAISFFTESVTYNLPQKLKVKKWIKATIEKEGFFGWCNEAFIEVDLGSYLLGDEATKTRHNYTVVSQ